MAAAYVSHTTGAASRSVTVPAGTDRLLVVTTIGSSAFGSARTVTYGGVACTAASTTNDYVQIHYMLDPPAGAATLSVSGTGISTVVAAHYTGITSFQTSSEASVASASFSPSRAGVVVFGLAAVTTSHTPVAGTTERHDSGGDWYGDRVVTGSGAVTVGVSSATDPDSAGAIFLEPVAGATLTISSAGFSADAASSAATTVLGHPASVAAFAAAAAALVATSVLGHPIGAAAFSAAAASSAATAVLGHPVSAASFSASDAALSATAVVSGPAVVTAAAFSAAAAAGAATAVLGHPVSAASFTAASASASASANVSGSRSVTAAAFSAPGASMSASVTGPAPRGFRARPRSSQTSSQASRFSWEPPGHLPDTSVAELARAVNEQCRGMHAALRQVDTSARRHKRRVTDLVEAGSVIARPGEVVRVQPGDEDVTVYLPEPGPDNGGEDVVVSFEGDGSATGRVRIQPINGTCLVPGTQTLNAPGQYRFTSTGAGTAKPAASRRTASTATPTSSAWAGPPPVTTADLPADIAGDGLTGGAGSPLSVGAGDGIDVGPDGIAVDVVDIAGSGLESDGANNLRIAAAAAGAGLIGGAGAALAVGAGTGITVGADSVSVTNPLTTNAVTNTELADMAQSRIKGRAEGAGTGDPQDLTPAQVVAVIDAENATWTGTHSFTGAAHTVNVAGAVGLTAGTDVAVAATDDILLNASSGVAIVAGSAATGFPVTTVTPGDALIRASDGVAIEAEGAAGVSITAAGASSFTTSVGNLTLQSTATASRVSVLGQNDVVLQTVEDAIFIDSAANTQITAGGAALIDANAASRFSTSVGNLTLQSTEAGSRVSVLGQDDVVVQATNDAVFIVSGDETTITAGGLFRLTTATVERLEVTTTGAWQVNGGSGTSGYPLCTNGSAASPEWQQLGTAGIADAAVTDAKLRNSVALSVIGRSANSTGVPADIAAGTDGHVLRRSGTTLGFGTIATAGITDAAVTNAKLANMAQATVKGRASGAGTGVPTDLSANQVATIVAGEPFGWSGTHVFNNDVRFESTLRLAGILTSAATAANNLAIGTVSAVRFTGPVDPLTGMVATGGGQVVLLINAHASTNMGVHIESASSTSSNRFAGVGTSRVIRPGEMALAWYDSDSSRWRLLCRDEVDL